MATVVTCVLRHRGEVLLERRTSGLQAGRWDLVSGPLEGDDPRRAARRLVAERTGLEEVEFVRAGGRLTISGGGQADADGDGWEAAVGEGEEWTVRPFLFDCASRDLAPADAEREWTSPTELLRRGTAPWAWRAYQRVAPTVRTVAADDEHGSAYVSVRALEVVRNRAGLIAAERATTDEDDGGDAPEVGPADGVGELRDLARRVRAARPRMAALANRVNRAVATADPTPGGVETAALEGIERALAADEAAAERAADRVAGRRVLTLSRSGTVLSALRSGEPAAVFVAESRPAREGVGVAERLAEHTSTVLHTDAAVADVLARRDVDLVLVGADAVGPDGTLVNKTGTRAAAVAAAHEDHPFYAVTASDKVAPEPVGVEREAGGGVYDGDAPMEAYNPLFDETPHDLVAGVITERGTLSTAGIREVADEHARLAEWDD